MSAEGRTTCSYGIPLRSVGVSLGVIGQHRSQLSTDQIKMAVKVSTFLLSDYKAKSSCYAAHFLERKITVLIHYLVSCSYRNHLGRLHLGSESLAPSSLYPDFHPEIIPCHRLHTHGHCYPLLCCIYSLVLPQLPTLDGTQVR